MRLVRWMLGALHEERVRQLYRPASAAGRLAQVELAPLMGRTLDWLVQDGRHQEMLTQSLRFSLVMLHDNRELIRGNVQRESPWWVPGFVDDKIVVQMLDRIEMLLAGDVAGPRPCHAGRISTVDESLGG